MFPLRLFFFNQPTPPQTKYHFPFCFQISTAHLLKTFLSIYHVSVCLWWFCFGFHCVVCLSTFLVAKIPDHIWHFSWAGNLTRQIRTTRNVRKFLKNQYFMPSPRWHLTSYFCCAGNKSTTQESSKCQLTSGNTVASQLDHVGCVAPGHPGRRALSVAADTAHCKQHTQDVKAQSPRVLIQFNEGKPTNSFLLRPAPNAVGSICLGTSDCFCFFWFFFCSASTGNWVAYFFSVQKGLLPQWLNAPSNRRQNCALSFAWS